MVCLSLWCSEYGTNFKITYCSIVHAWLGGSGIGGDEI